jgi:hypothetical protein
MQFACLAPIVVAAFLCPTESSVSCGEKAKKEPEKLSEKDEATLRAVVGKHVISTARWAPGGGNPYELGKSFRVLVLPQKVGEIFKRTPVGTLRALKRIIESGSSADAHAAIAYAHAAVGYANEDPVQLICACSYAYYPTAKEFDDKNPVIPKTYRQFAVEEIDNLIADVEKQVTGETKKQEK